MLLHLGIGSHDDCSTKLFGGQKPCYDGQWLLTGRYFKCCIQCQCRRPYYKIVKNFGSEQ